MAEIFERRDPATLKNHPLSIEVYGESLDDHFVASVKEQGILVPLRILRNGTIIHGRRRRMLAMKWRGSDKRFQKVPCVIADGDLDDLEVQEQVLHCNIENDRSNEVKIRVFKELKRIEVERAERRMKSGKTHKKETNGGPSDKLSEGPTGEAAVIASDKVGLSRVTAEKGVEVIEAIDELKEKGHTKKAAELTETLNENVSAAHREIEGDKPNPVKDPAGNVIPKRIQKPFELVPRFRGLINKIGSIMTEVEEMAKERGGEKLPLAAVRIAVKDLQATIKPAMPFAICPFCKGIKCSKCKDTGWLHEDAWNGIPKAKREEMLA